MLDGVQGVEVERRSLVLRDGRCIEFIVLLVR